TWGAVTIDVSLTGGLTNDGTMVGSRGPSVTGNGTFTNNGRIVLQGPDDLNVGGYVNGQGLVVTLDNTPHGVIDLQSDAGIHGGNGILASAGPLGRTGGTGVSAIFESLNNSGTIDAEAGTIRLVGANTAGPDGTDDTDGTFQTAAGAAIELARGSERPFLQSG